MEWNTKKYQKYSQMQLKIGKILIKHLAPSINESILDIGCGTGVLSIKIAQKIAPGILVGIDVDQNMIQEAHKALQQKNIKNVKLIEKSATIITYTDHFNAVFSNIVLHWIKDLPELIKKIYRSLQSKGRIALAVLFEEDTADINDTNKTKNKITIQQIELKILQTFMQEGHFIDILSLEEFQAHQQNVSKELNYKIYKIPEYHQMLKVAGFSEIEIKKEIYWNQIDNVNTYFEHRESNLWRFFLAYFPKQFHAAVINKLRTLISSEWDIIPTNKKVFPIQEKWPIAYISAKK